MIFIDFLEGINSVMINNIKLDIEIVTYVVKMRKMNS